MWLMATLLNREHPHPQQAVALLPPGPITMGNRKPGSAEGGPAPICKDPLSTSLLFLGIIPLIYITLLQDSLRENPLGTVA